MNQYVTGAIIKKLRENRKLTQAELAQRLNISDKAISKWETGKGYPDITLIEPLAKALDISVMELLAGVAVINQNRSANMERIKWYVCPVCGNIISSTGEAVVSCCGVTLPLQEEETPDLSHQLTLEPVEDEYYVTISHSMTKEHYISFLAVAGDNGVQMVKLYPEGNAEARFKCSRVKALYAYCNRHGLFKVKV